MKISTLVWGLVGVIAFSGVARSQSLADIARKEEERRKSVKTPAKVYTNDDLRRYPVSTLPEATAPDPAQAAAAGDAAAAKPDQPTAQAKDATSPSKDATPSVDQGEQHWRQLITEARSARARSSTYLEALESRVAALTAEFYAREDPGQRAAAWGQRTRVLEDMERLKQDMAEQDKAIAKIEEDARKANVPPGWIR
jgi:hypothetical protein